MKKPTTPTENPALQPSIEQPVVAVSADAADVKPKQVKVTPKTPSKPKAVAPKPVPKAKAKGETEIAPSVSDAPQKPKALKSTKLPKPATKAQAEATPQVAKPAELTVSERVGLTAGSLWRYLSENGASPVAKLLRELPEDEKIIQRSIGWLAHEGKITLVTNNRVETIDLAG